MDIKGQMFVNIFTVYPDNNNLLVNRIKLKSRDLDNIEQTVN